MLSNRDERKAQEVWEEYYEAIKEYELDSIQDRNHHSTIDYMYDAFFVGFYAGRDHGVSKF